jgi:hypothetical protein
MSRKMDQRRRGKRRIAGGGVAWRGGEGRAAAQGEARSRHDAEAAKTTEGGRAEDGWRGGAQAQGGRTGLEENVVPSFSLYISSFFFEKNYVQQSCRSQTVQNAPDGGPRKQLHSSRRSASGSAFT